MQAKKKIYLVATMDTKSTVAFYLKNEIELLGHEVAIIDVGLKEESPPGVAITQKEVLGDAFEEIMASNTRERGSQYVTERVSQILISLYKDNSLDAVVSLGGSGGSGIACGAMHHLPFGVPKVVISTMASGNTLPYVQGEDILMINPVVDMQNLNFMTCYALKSAAAILNGLLTVGLQKNEKKAVAISAFGVTTACVDYCVSEIEKLGYEVLIFHARGISGGKIMEKMIRENRFAAVLDITTSEVADEICGGIYGVANRLKAAAESDIPYIVIPGALEMINLSTEDTLLPEQKTRVLYKHSKSSVKMRTSKSDILKIAKVFIERLSSGNKKISLLIPKQGFSSVNKKGGVFFDEEVNLAFVNEVTENMPSFVNVQVEDLHINDKEFGKKIIQHFEFCMKGEK